MQIIYDNGTQKRCIDVGHLYKEVAEMLSHEDISSPTSVKVQEAGNPFHMVDYQISERSGTRFITELCNTMPEEYQEQVHSVFLTCVNPQTNAYKFYRLDPKNGGVRATYGRMGTEKGKLFGARSFDYPLSMFWVKYYEKLSKGYVDRSDIYLTGEEKAQRKDCKRAKPAARNNRNAASVLFAKLKELAEHAVKEAKVKVPVTPAILDEAKRLLGNMRNAQTLDEFNGSLLELISVLQRPVKTGDGTGVRSIMADDKSQFADIIQREDDLIQAMEGVLSDADCAEDTEQDNAFLKMGIEVYEATPEQEQEVMNHLSNTLRHKVSKIYRVIPREQEKKFQAYLKKNQIKKVKQYWHGSRNQNWLSIIVNSLKLNPDAIITGKMFGNGIYFAPSPDKSWNYTSFHGTTWARGRSNTGYMGLYAVAYGEPEDIQSWEVTDYEAMVKRKGKNCLHAHKGASLRADEIVFYDEDAVVLNYIVEFH